MRLVVVGADAAGMSAAAKAKRETRGSLSVIAFDRGRYTSYAACGMPYFLSGEVPSLDRLVARTLTDHAKQDLDVRLRHEVIAVDPEAGRVRVRDLDGGSERDEPYDALLLATGAVAIEPPFPGRELPGVHGLKRLDEAEAIAARIGAAKRAVVIGGGYIGVEVAEALARRGLETHLVQSHDRLLTSLDEKTSELARAELERHQVRVHLGAEVLALEGSAEEGVRSVTTRAGRIDADLVVVAVGVRPATELAEPSGVETGVRGAFVTNARMETRVAGIWAAGDCCQALHRVTGKPAWIPLGDTANRMGRIAGTNIAGGDARFAGVVGTAVTRIFDLGIGRTGLTAKEATEAGFQVKQVSVVAPAHARYMPGTTDVSVLLTWDEPSGRILGGQVVARGDAVKRIDALAIAITAGFTLEDLRQADLAYAPPFSPVWDPLIVAANVAE